MLAFSWFVIITYVILILNVQEYCSEDMCVSMDRENRQWFEVFIFDLGHTWLVTDDDTINVCFSCGIFMLVVGHNKLWCKHVEVFEPIWASLKSYTYTMSTSDVM